MKDILPFFLINVNITGRKSDSKNTKNKQFIDKQSKKDYNVNK